MPSIDLNADLGERSSATSDEALLACITSANIACGGHAGDESTMRRVLRAALERDVRIGAHPSYPDRENFGRVSMKIDPQELRDSLAGQVERLMNIASSEAASVEYLKPHGALYNDAANSEKIAEVIFEVASDFSLRVMALARSSMAAMYPDRVIGEGFIDRGYRDDGTLVPRRESGALITDPEVSAAQAVRLASIVDSLCVHSDTPNALMILRAAREVLIREGYAISGR